MKKNFKMQYILATVLVVLLLLSLTTGIFAANLLFTIDSEDSDIKFITLDVNVEDSNSKTQTNENNNQSNDTNLVDNSTPTNNATQNNTSNNTNATQPTNPTVSGNTETNSNSSNPGLEVVDENGVWGKDTTITLFKAFYDNEKGEITVKSADGDSVIAPGTSNQYAFIINNIGDTGIQYWLETKFRLSFTVNGEEKSVPLQAKLYSMNGAYLVGSENSFADIAMLDGVKDSGSLSSRCHTKYTIEWQWPFEGNDELDTLIGNIAADDELTVEIEFIVTASEDENASGGAPSTGDNQNVGFWVAVGVYSFVALIILLLGYKRRENEEETAK